jgi:hypothetical protein
MVVHLAHLSLQAWFAFAPVQDLPYLVVVLVVLEELP